MKYFSVREFDCPCCGENRMHIPFMEKLDKAREYAGIKFVVSSGYRCKKHNASISNSTPLSAHVDGKAADIVCTDSQARWRILFGLFAAGFRRIGVYQHHIHADLAGREKPQPVVFIGSY